MADVRRFSDAEINRLVKFYEQVEREILDRLNRALLRGNKTEYLDAMKKNVEAILQQLREGNRTWCTEAIPRVYTEGLKNADAMLKDAGVTLKAGFGAIHQQAAQVLAENAFQRLEDVAQVIGRQVNDIYRELALENVRGTVVGYDTWKQTARRFREQLAERGVTGFKDRTGRMWNMRTYTKMVARTTTMEAHLQGTANRLVEQGRDLVKVSTHRGACPLCEPWQGKILSITGKTEGYPTLEEAKAAGLFHPNCRHAYGLYIDLDKEIEELEAEERGIESKDRETPIITTKDFDQEIYDWIKASNYPHNLMSPSEYNEIFLKKGFSLEEIKTVRKILSDYGGVAAQQKKAMETIAAEIKNDSRIGKLLRATSDLEEAAIEIWQSGLEDRIKKAIKDAKEDWDLFGQAEGFSKDYSDFSEVETAIRTRLEKEASLVVYRKGDLGRPIESWTTDPLGADIGRGHRLTPDHAMTLSEMHKRGYSILGGTCRMMGSPGEMEITFINFDKCTELYTPSFPSVPKKTLERAMHDPDYLSQMSVHGDLVLQDMAEEVGFHRKPTLLSKEEMDAYIQQGNRELLRGLAGRQGKAEAYVEQFKTGEYFAGKGVYGNGIYTAYGEDRMEVAKQFADGVEKNVLRMSLKKDAKIISYDALIEMQKLEFTALQDEERALRRKARKEADRIYDETGDDDKVEMFLKEAAKEWEEMEKYRRVLVDPGRYALYKGYDAIDITSPGFMVVFNRGKVFVQK